MYVASPSFCLPALCCNLLPSLTSRLTALLFAVRCCALLFSALLCAAGNEKLQQMMSVMARERGGKVCTMDHRYCIDNGAMIAWAGLLLVRQGITTPLKECTVTQRFRTDEVECVWRKD
jgi:N6-L-threonylcarbamoyladenine synthase